MDTKPWYQSKTIIAGIGTFLAGLAMVAKFFFQVDIADQVPILSGGLLAVLALVGSVVTVYGRFTAKTIIAPKDDLPTVGGPLIRLLLVGALMGTCLSLPGCANLSQSLPYVRTGASVACGTVLRMAVSDQDRVDVANDIFVIGSVFDSLSGGADRGGFSQGRRVHLARLDAGRRLRPLLSANPGQPTPGS
jgi:hypothetical protein